MAVVVVVVVVGLPIYFALDGEFELIFTLHACVPISFFARHCESRMGLDLARLGRYTYHIASHTQAELGRTDWKPRQFAVDIVVVVSCYYYYYYCSPNAAILNSTMCSFSLHSLFNICDTGQRIE